MKISRKVFDELCAELEAEGAIEDSDADVRTDYSGRGMWGGTCIGFTVDNPLNFIFALCEAVKTVCDEMEWEEDVLDIRNFHNAQMDGMGLSSIVYFPGISLADD